jgi:hypothetical protein
MENSGHSTKPPLFGMAFPEFFTACELPSESLLSGLKMSWIRTLTAESWLKKQRQST